MTRETFLNIFAISSFRDIADSDYIAARLACRAKLVSPYLWSSLQALEKYFKCILLLHRIDGRRIRHDLTKAISRIEGQGGLQMHLSGKTRGLIDHLDTYGRFRYLETPSLAFGAQIVDLDRAVWEVRRFCTLEEEPRRLYLRNLQAAPKYRITGGVLEDIVDDPKHPAREPLLWQNGFFGKRTRKIVRLKKWFRATNSPLSLYPEFVDEVKQLVFLPEEVQRAYSERCGKQSNSKKTQTGDQRQDSHG